MIEEEAKKALGPGGFELMTSRLQDHHSNHYATTTARLITLWQCKHDQKKNQSDILTVLFL